MSSNLNFNPDAEVSSSSTSSSSRAHRQSTSSGNNNSDTGNSKKGKQKSRVRLSIEDQDQNTDIGSTQRGADGDSLVPVHGSIHVEEDDRLLQELANLPPAEPIHLSFWKKLVIASGHVLNDLCASLWFTYALLYFDKVVGFSDPTDSTKKTNHAALVILIGQLVDGIATPLIGYEADQPVNWLCNQTYGRCKSWHVMGSFLSIISFPFIFSACIGCSVGTSNWVKLIYYIPFVVIFQIGWASVQISHLALIPKMHPDDLVRTDILAKRYGFTVCSNILVFLMTWFTLGNGAKCRITPADSTQFMQIGVISVGIGALFTLFFHFGVKEHSDNKVKKNVAVITSRTKIIRRLSHSVDMSSGVLRTRTDSIRSRKSAILEVHTPSTSRDAEDGGDSDGGSERGLVESGSLEGRVIGYEDIRSSEEQEYVSLVTKPSYFSTKCLSLGREKMSLKDWFTLPQFYIVALIYMATRMSVNLGQVFVSYFVQYSLWLPCNTVATVPLTMFVSGLLVSFGIRLLNKHLGRQVSYALSALLTIAGALMVLLVEWDGPNSEFHKTYLIYVVAAMLGGGSSGILITSLSITADMIGNNVENGAFVYGSMSFCDKLSCGLGILLVDSLKPCEYNDDDPNIPVEILSDCKTKVTPYYQNVLAFSTGGCAFIGILACILLTYRIHYQNSRMKKDDTGPT